MSMVHMISQIILKQKFKQATLYGENVPIIAMHSQTPLIFADDFLMYDITIVVIAFLLSPFIVF